MNTILKAFKQNNWFVFNDRKLAEDALRAMPQEFSVVFKPIRKLRSLNQNSYYWGVVLKLLHDHTGQPQDDLHDILKRKFLGEATLRLGDTDYVFARSTATLSTVQFEEYLSSVRVWAFDTLKVIIPLPNEVDWGEE